jgi:hypothetical protein
VDSYLDDATVRSIMARRTDFAGKEDAMGKVKIGRAASDS